MCGGSRDGRLIGLTASWPSCLSSERALGRYKPEKICGRLGEGGTPSHRFKVWDDSGTISDGLRKLILSHSKAIFAGLPTNLGFRTRFWLTGSHPFFCASTSNRGRFPCVLHLLETIFIASSSNHHHVSIPTDIPATRLPNGAHANHKRSNLL